MVCIIKSDLYNQYKILNCVWCIIVRKSANWFLQVLFRSSTGYNYTKISLSHGRQWGCISISYSFYSKFMHTKGKGRVGVKEGSRNQNWYMLHAHSKSHVHVYEVRLTFEYPDCAPRWLYGSRHIVLLERWGRKFYSIVIGRF